MSKRKIRMYDKEFKQNAVALYLKNNRSYSQVSQELGIPSATLVGWVLAYQKSPKEAFPGKGSIKDGDQEVWKLKRLCAFPQDVQRNIQVALAPSEAAQVCDVRLRLHRPRTPSVR